MKYYLKKKKLKVHMRSNLMERKILCERIEKKKGYSHTCIYDFKPHGCTSKICKLVKSRFHPRLRIKHMNDKPNADDRSLRQSFTDADEIAEVFLDLEKETKIEYNETKILVECYNFFDTLFELFHQKQYEILEKILEHLREIEQKKSNDPLSPYIFLFKTWPGSLGLDYNKKMTDFIGTYNKPSAIIYLALIDKYFKGEYLQDLTLFLKKLDDHLGVARVDVTNIQATAYSRELKYDSGYLIPLNKNIDIKGYTRGKTLPFQLFEQVFPTTYGKFEKMFGNNNYKLEGIELGYLDNATMDIILTNYYIRNKSKGKKTRKRQKNRKKKKIETIKRARSVTKLQKKLIKK